MHDLAEADQVYCLSSDNHNLNFESLRNHSSASEEAPAEAEMRGSHCSFFQLNDDSEIFLPGDLGFLL